MTRVTHTQGDITEMAVDAIVNAANSPLAGGGGVDGAIHRAGGPSILEECRSWVAEHGPLPTGEAMATAGGNLAARHVIHTVGPIWGEDTAEAARNLLSACYRNSLDLANTLECRTIAFPNISTGVYGFPKKQAAEIAVESVRIWIQTNSGMDQISFVCFDDENLAIYSSLLGA